MPEHTALAWAEAFRKAGGRRVLDLGCGIGRHTIALTRLGLAVTASDVAPSGLMTCAAWLAHERLAAVLVCHEMRTLPFPDATFDGLLAYNVIYHATVAGMQQTVSEIRRVLCPGGWLYITAIACSDSKVASYRADIETGKCQEIEPFTFVYLYDAPADKYLPHHYCDEEEVRDLLTGFAIKDVRLDHREYADSEGMQVGVHYHVQARLL
jgi:SAM-dependent methyltransferase